MNIKDNLLGAAVGGTLAFIAGQLGPQVAAPEEVITVPMAAAVGGIIGYKKVRQFVKHTVGF